MICSYNILAPVTFGSGSVSQTGRICSELGGHKALIVTEKALVKLGLTDKVCASLKEAGIEYAIYDGVLPDAPDTVAAEGKEAAVKLGADAVIGVGGGSTLDSAKAISVYTATGWTMERFMQPGPPVDNPKLITIMIPTTFGTGSESSQIAVVSNTKNGYKTGIGCIASAAIIDPELSLGLPRGVTAYTGMDAFSHAAEVLCSNAVENPHSDLLAYDAIGRILKWLPVAVEDINNLEARENLALASNFAGIAFADAIVNLGHAMAHALGAECHIPHGVACAWVTPCVMEFMGPVCGDKYRPVAEMMGLDVSGCDGAEVARRCASFLRDFMKKLDIPTCASFKLTEKDFLDRADYVKNEAMRGLGKRVPNDEEVSELLSAVYNSCK